MVNYDIFQVFQFVIISLKNMILNFVHVLKNLKKGYNLKSNNVKRYKIHKTKMSKLKTKIFSDKFNRFTKL